MNKICRFAAAWVFILPLFLASCATEGSIGSTDPSADKTCREGVCAEIDIAQPIELNQQANVTITISSTVDYPGLLIHLAVSPTTVVTFGSDTDWNYNAVTGQSQTYHAIVTLLAPGEYFIAAHVYEKGGPVVENFDRVVIDTKGAIVNPTIEPASMGSGDPVALPPQPEVLTETAAAIQTQIQITPTPLPPVEGFTAQEWLHKCGWTVEKPNILTLWAGVSGGLHIKETAILDEPVNGTLAIGFKDNDNPNTPVEVRIGLCTLGQGWTTGAIHEWNAELRHAVPYETPVSLHFTDVGEIPIFIVVLDTQNNRIAGIGRLIFVKPKK